jgi:hypothetical protein
VILFTVTLSWPLIVAVLCTLGVFGWLAWMHSEPPSGPYDMTGVFTFPVAAFFIAVVWMLYFAFRVWWGF